MHYFSCQHLLQSKRFQTVNYNINFQSNPLTVMQENASLTEDSKTELIKLLEMTLSVLKSTNIKF